MDGKLRNMTAVYLLHGDKILFLYRQGSRVVGDSYVGTAGGHFEKSELNDARACVIRELFEETGLTEKDLRDFKMRYITLRLKNGEVRQNYYFFAYLDEPERIKESAEGKLEWVPFDRALSLDMPVTAKFMLQHFLQVGIHDNRLYGGVTEETGMEFHVLREF